MPLYLTNKNGSCRGICDLLKLIDTLKEFIKDLDNTKFIIHIDCGSLYYHPDLDEYNFDHISTNKFLTPASPMAQTHSTAVLPSVLTTTTSLVSSIHFNSLPPSVKSRYDAYQNGTFVHYTALEQEFTWTDGSKYKYYEDAIIAQQRLFINTGAIFHFPYNSKAFKKDPPLCTNETPTGLQCWYTLFRQHCYAYYGLYIPPYENIRMGMIHDGFEFGIDIPLHLQENQDIWCLDLHTVLQQVFSDKQSKNQLRVSSTTTNGFHKLLAILKPTTHPLCRESPSTIIGDGDPPSQSSDKDLPTFWAGFYDQDVLDTIFLHGNFDPKSKHTLDRFLRKCTHGQYLIKAR
jgi:hypothetical protein